MAEINPYVEWIRQMPEENKEHFLRRDFERYLDAWRTCNSTTELMEKEVNRQIKLLMDTKEFKLKVKEQLGKILDGFRGDDIVSKLTNELIQKLKDAEDF